MRIREKFFEIAQTVAMVQKQLADNQQGGRDEIVA